MGSEMCIRDSDCFVPSIRQARVFCAHPEVCVEIRDAVFQRLLAREMARVKLLEEPPNAPKGIAGFPAWGCSSHTTFFGTSHK